MSEQRTTETLCGAKTAKGERRPEYYLMPDRSRDSPSDGQLKGMRGFSGSKIWRKAREGKL